MGKLWHRVTDSPMVTSHRVFSLATHPRYRSESLGAILATKKPTKYPLKEDRRYAVFRRGSLFILAGDASFILHGDELTQGDGGDVPLLPHTGILRGFEGGYGVSHLLDLALAQN